MVDGSVARKDALCPSAHCSKWWAGVRRLGVRSRKREPVRRGVQADAVLHPRRADGEGGRHHHEGRVHASEWFLDRFVCAVRRLEARGPDDRRWREHGRPKGHLDGRQGSDRRGFGLPVPRVDGRGEDVFLQGAADVLRRNGRRLDRSRVLGHAGPDDRGEVVFRGRWEQHARDRRACAGRARTGLGCRRSRRQFGETLAGMSRRGRIALLLVLAAGALAPPAAAWAHAVLLRTSPLPSSVVNRPPPVVLLTYSEAVEPRFAIVSVTNAAGQQQIAGPPRRSAADPKTLVVSLHHLSQGWYLVYWRVISVDGHPVRGAFTFAVGPNPGPAPQFPVPSTSETAATPSLVTARAIVLLSVMAAIGLFVLRIATARPIVRRVPETRLRAVSIAFGIASAVALIGTPVYVVMATAQFALRSAFDLGNVLPLVRDSAFGRDYLDLELTVALFVLAAALALWVDRPERRQRSIAELLATGGALLAAGATLFVPGLSGH